MAATLAYSKPPGQRLPRLRPKRQRPNRQRQRAVGPQTKRLAELRAYDDDGNSWIDENDRIFSQPGLSTLTNAGLARFTSAPKTQVLARTLFQAQPKANTN